MLEQKTKGVVDYSTEKALRGSGELESTTDYMNVDPITYYYNKFKTENNRYFDETMWSEAARRGESEALISNILRNESQENEMFQKLKEYEGRVDYDTYVVALEYPFLKDTEPTDRIADNGYNFGKYTNKQWAQLVLENTVERYDAEIVQEQKENQGFMSRAFWTTVTELSKVAAGFGRGVQDLVNVGEGLVNLVQGKDFLEAYADDEGEIFHDITKALDTAIYEYQRKYTYVVNAVDAYEQGYKFGEGDNFIEQLNNTVNVGAGYTTWGKYMNAMTDSIGYMLPTILLNIPTGGTGTIAQLGGKTAGLTAKGAAALKNGLFYTQIFSGMVGENVQTALANGVTLEQLNHNEIIANSAIKAVAQWGIEKALGAIIGFSSLDKLIGATSSRGITGITSQMVKSGTKLAEQVGRTGLKAFGTATGRIAKDLIKEGLEETLQDMSDGIIDTVFGGFYRQRGTETLSINNLLDSFIVGALTAGVIGAISNAEVIWKRDALIDNNGKAYKLGLFQQMNYNEAMRTMNDWSAVLNDNKATAKQKADAAFKLNAYMSTVGNIFKTFGTERTKKALSLLTAYQNREDIKAANKAKEKLSNEDFAKSLLFDFQQGLLKANLQHVSQKISNTLEKALTKKAPKLKEANVTKLENVITEDIDVNDLNISIPKDSAQRLQQALKQLGVSVIVGHDGNIITRSGQVIFANDSLIKSGDVATILQGISYDVAVEAYSNAMTAAQKQFLLDHYKQLTNNDKATLDDAVIALLFDKDFYCYMLLKTREKAKPSTLFNNRSLQLLATMDKVVKNAASNENVKGRLSIDAYNVLISKIQENMKTGLFTFATQYAYIDLANVSKEIVGDIDISALKTAIKMNRNVQFTETINKIFSSSENKVIENSKITAFDNIIEKYRGRLLDSEIDEAKQKIRKASYLDRLDAKILLTFLASKDFSDDSKLVYLPLYTQNNMDALNVRKSIQAIEKQFGAKWADIIKGNIDNVPIDTQNYIASNGYNLNNRAERLSLLDEMLWENSGHTLGVANDGSIMQIVDKESIVKSEYLTMMGEFQLFKEIRSGKMTVQDICNQPIDPRIGKIKLVIDADIMLSNTRGYYNPNENTIYLSNIQLIDNIMHELTHATQSLIVNNSTVESSEKLSAILGGSDNMFALMKDSESAKLYEYLQKNLSLSYSYIQSQGGTDPQIAYYMLAGELQANAKMTSRMFETGFKFNKDRTILYAPLEDNIKFDLTMDVKKLQSSKLLNDKAKTKTKTNNMEASRLPDAQTGLRYVAQKRARLSNLKYFIRKGSIIQMHSGLASFIESTTHDFQKLPKVLRNEIEAGTLTKQKLDHYLQTSKRINDYTYQMAARYIFNNEAAAEISYNDMTQIEENIQQLAALSYVLTKTTNSKLHEYANKKLSPNQMFKLLNMVNDKIKQGNSKLATLYAKGLQWASTVYAGKDMNGKAEYFDASEEYGDRLNLYFLRNYDGTLKSLYAINNLGKYQLMKEQPARYNDYIKKSSGGTYNWIDKLKKADIDYEKASTIMDANIVDPGVTQALDMIDKQDKINAIADHMLKSLEAEIRKAGPEGSNARVEAAKAGITKYNEMRNQLDTASEETLNQKYLLATGAEMLESDKTISTKALSKTETKEQIGTHATDKTRKNAIVNEANRLRNLMGKVSPVTYRNMPTELKNVMSQAADGTLVLNDNYLSMNSNQLENLIVEFQAFNNKYRALKNITEAEMGLRARTKKTKEYLQQMANEKSKTVKDANVVPQVNAKGENVDMSKPKTMREKVDIIHRVKIKEESFGFDSRETVTDTAKQVLNTAWDKERMSTVKGLQNNEEHNISNGKAFYEQNATALSNMSTSEAEATAKWFMDVKMTNTTNDTEEYKKFTAVQLYTLGYIFGQTKNNGLFSQMNANTKQQLENFLRTRATVAGTALAVWNNIQDKINPIEQIFKNLEIGGVELSDAEQSSLIKAAEEGDIDKIAQLQKDILDRIKTEKISKKGIGKQITTYRALSMLSSPLTWLRNVVSNFMLKNLNKLSNKIGNSIWTSKQKAGQLTLLQDVKVDEKTGRIIGGTITPEIQNFINDNFIDNKLFDTLISDLSKYNPSDIQQKYRQPDGTMDKNAIFANMVLKSLYNKYYNQNMFKGKFMNSVYQLLMKMMSDNNYVREAAVRYFGKIIADRNYDLTRGVTDNIMTDFASAVGVAMSDYMHSDNFLNSFERIIAEKGEGWHTLYKIILPFAASNFNWFKAAIRYSPIGLGQSIYKMIKLEKTVIKAEAAWAAGKSQISPDMTLWLVRRDLGSGIIGTMSLLLGAALAGLGFIRLEDEDYGTPKLRIGNVKIDVSSVFGSSSLLVGAGLVNGFQKKGMTIDGVLESLNNSLDIALDGFFLSDLMALDLYSDGQFSTLLNITESTILSFIPNFISYLAGATYFGDKKKTNFWQKLVAKIPFLANVLPNKIDPYTGQTTGALAVFNRMVPYLTINIESNQEKIAKSYGLNKKELTGNYTINDEQFKLSPKETAEINKQYGEWNAKYLTEFLDDSTLYKIKDSKTGKTKMLSYSQMTEEQRLATIKKIMSTNANYAKILAWTNSGNYYYATDEDYNELMERNIRSNVYRGNKGFVKK